MKYAMHNLGRSTVSQLGFLVVFFFCRAGCCKCQAHAVVTWIRVFALHKLSSSDIISIINDMGTTVIATIFSSYCFSVYLLDFIKFLL